MNALENELKPCPFCGSAPAVSYDEKCEEWWICCGHGSCSIEPKVAMRGYRDAASAWNRRPLPEGAQVPGIWTETMQSALAYINHVGSNWTMRGEPHPQQWLVTVMTDLLKQQERVP